MIMPDRNYHESSRAHVTGAALYADDISNIGNLLHGYVQASTLARGTLCALDLERVRQSPGVVAVLTAADVPGVNDLSHLPDGGGEPLFIEKEINNTFPISIYNSDGNEVSACGNGARCIAYLLSKDINKKQIIFKFFK